MSTSDDNVDVLDEFPEVAGEADSEATSNTFEETVNSVIDGVKKKEGGGWEFPAGATEEAKYAATAELRRRDTQAAHDRNKQTLTATEAKASKLEEKLLSNVSLNLSDAEREELVELKETNPDAWRVKINEHEQTAKTKVSEELEELDSESTAVSELERRTEVLEDFNKANPDLVLNDEVFNNDLPPRIVKKLADGEVTFEEFLEEAKNFLSGSTVIQGATSNEEDEPHLGKAGGGGSISDAAMGKDTAEDYEKDVIF